MYLDEVSAPILVAAGGLAGALLGISATSLDVNTQRMTLWVSIFFGGFGLTPVGVALYMLFPDWSLMYLIHPLHSGRAYVLVSLVLVYVTTPLLGCIIARYFMVTRRGWYFLWGAWICGVLVALLMVLAGWNRLTAVAYYESFHLGGLQIGLLSSSLSPLLAVSLVTLASVYGFSFWCVVRLSRRRR